MSPSITATVCIVSPKTADLTEVTNALDMQPTKVWRQEKVATTNPTLDYQEWQLELREIPARDFDTAVQTALEPFWVRREFVNEFCERTSSHVTVHLRPHADSSEIVYALDDPETIQRLADLAARIHFHFDDIVERT